MTTGGEKPDNRGCSVVTVDDRWYRICVHTAQVTGSIPVAPTPIAQSGVWNWSTSPLEGVAVPESVSVSVPPGSPGLVAPGSRMISTEPGPRLGRERLSNGGIQCEPVRDENPCAAWISTVSSTWHEPLILTTDQEVGDSSSSGRAAETPAIAGVSAISRRVRVLVWGRWAASGPRGFGSGCHRVV